MFSPIILQSHLIKGFNIYENYKNLLNSYVLDFFTEDHWNNLPESWRCTKNLSSDQIANLLDHENNSETVVLPLSILTLKVLFRELNISRIQYEDMSHSDVMEDPKLMKMFWKNVKLKKRHEIPIMAKLCDKVAKKCNCYRLVDVGAGLGHLSRMLTYGYNFEVCTIEAQEKLTINAGILDNQFDKIFYKKYGTSKSIKHINIKLETNITSEEFLNLVQSSFGLTDKNFEFGIVGLHPCGDLGPLLLRLYKELPNIKFVNVVGCCYMKLSRTGSGFPLSKFCKEHNYELCYHSKEIACHAIESYIIKLQEGEHWKLKIHAYRALIEKLIRDINPQYKHIPLATVKYTKDLPFDSYCKKATEKLNLIINSDIIKSQEVMNFLDEWTSVVLFYSFRLFFAPLIESLILYDRLLYLLEEGNDANLISAFDTRISPRMHVLQGIKTIEMDIE